MRIDFGKIKKALIWKKIEIFYWENKNDPFNKEKFYKFMWTTFKKSPSYYSLYLIWTTKKWHS